ncbi:MAG TPA: site-specific integrase [Kiritimatiellia bacterium]|nr:site-specific integrase [Kiritimatiellia bacterium]HRZ11381.1 site-specific integrase [Kiritimatiellia bacterium]HSA17068.1 site-specific integrase [Kiritimatiellia bacterium]
MRKKESKTTHYHGFAIRPTGFGTWMADNCDRTKRLRKCFDTLAEAKTWAENKSVDLKNHGLLALTLSDPDRRDAVAALTILSGATTLEKAAREYIRRHPQHNAEKLSWTCWRYLRQLYREGARPVTIKNARWKLRLWCKTEGENLTAGISRTEVDAWIERRGYKGQSRRGYERQLNALLSFYAGTRKRRELADATPPPVFTPQDVERLMFAAEQHDPGMVAPLTLLLFCGLRPYEMMRLTWDKIHLAEGEVIVPPEASKVRQARAVKLEPCALRWLAASRGSGNVAPGQYELRRRREALMEKAEIEAWPPDVARHTFASALYALKSDAAYVAAQLGHFGSLGVFARHYKAVMRQADAERFWTIEPHKKENVMVLGAS